MVDLLFRGGQRGPLPALVRRVPAAPQSSALTTPMLPRVVGRVPYGYRHGARGGLAVETFKAFIVDQAFRCFLRTKSVDAVCRDLNSGRYPQAGPRVWSPSSVRRMLRNTAYVGWHRQGLIRGFGVPLWLQVPAIVTLPMFLAAEQLLRPRRRPRTRCSRTHQRGASPTP